MRCWCCEEETSLVGSHVEHVWYSWRKFVCVDGVLGFGFPSSVEIFGLPFSGVPFFPILVVLE